MIRSTVVIAALVASLLMPATGATSTYRIEDGIVITSFDGEPIVATLMLPLQATAVDPVPAVLRTHGWGQRRSTEPDAMMQRLLDEGYAILTWDSRGFGHSGGEANFGSPSHEVRDASALIDYLATRPEVLQDRVGDPRIGWTGGSNAAGVQLNGAAIDKRVDAIVPQIGWGNLLEDLFPNGVYKQGWGERMYTRGLVGARFDGLESSNPAGSQAGDYAPEIHLAHEALAATGDLPRDLRAWYRARSTVIRSSDVQAPTLLMAGAIDTLFPLRGAFRNHRNLQQAGTPVKLLVMCSGHTLLGCPYPGGRSGHPREPAAVPLWEERIVSWLDRYVKKDAAADTGAPFEWQAPDGFYRAAPSYPLPRTRRVRGYIETPRLRGPGLSGGDLEGDARPAPERELGTTAVRRTVLATSARPRPLVGVPRVALRGRVRGAGGHLYLELVDVAPDGARVTVNHQSTPVEVAAGPVDVRTKMNGIVWVVRPGHRLELEVTTGSTMYQHSRAGAYSVKLRGRVELPVASARWSGAAART